MRDPDGVVDAFAAVFGVTARAGQTLEEALVEFLRTKQLLLVVDNCEHVLDAVADAGRGDRAVVSAGGGAGDQPGGSGARRRADPGGAVAGGPRRRTPTSTRSRRRDAVQLFVERAQGAKADFVLECGERRRGGAGVSASRRGAAGDRVGGGPGHVDEPGGAGVARWIAGSRSWRAAVAVR